MVEEGREEWFEARSLLKHRLDKLDRKVEQLEERILEQEKTIIKLQTKMSAIAAGVALFVSVLPWITEQLGITVGRK